MLHYFIDADSWDDYFPSPATENPLPETFDPPSRPVSLPRGGPWQYVDTDWAALDVTDEQFGGDWSVTKWIGQQLQQTHDKPFFLACGIYRPHEPWFVPKKYFEPFPLQSIQLPPGYKANDLDDVPAAGVRGAKNRYFDHIQAEGQWRQGIQSYLASIHFADAMLGRVLDALESGPHANTTIVVLWSDHGWQLGEKEHWQKYTAWRAVTRVPLMVRVPSSLSSALPRGTLAGIFGNEMVLQQKSNVAIWGKAAPGEIVSVTPSWPNAIAETRADDRGDWRTTVPTPIAGGPYTLTVRSGDRTVQLSDVLVGEVWICSGQSNMQWKLKGFGLEQFKDDVEKANFPQIRFCDVPAVLALEGQDDVTAKWTTCRPKTALEFSAVGYFFGSRLHQELGVPIGLVSTNWGGSSAEAWVSPEVLDQQFPEFAGVMSDYPAMAGEIGVLHPRTKKLPKGINQTSPSVLYNSMIRPLIPYTVRGAV